VPLANLERRARLLARTRAFFERRGVLEVETPLLAAGVIVERHIDPIACSSTCRPRPRRA
jgi:lysyl-tRNA synthetase class 2